MVRLLPGVRALVRLEVALVREAAPALRARIRPLACVNALVHPQVAHRREALAALRAAVETFACVELLVRPKVPQLGETTATLRTLVSTPLADPSRNPDPNDPGPDADASSLGTMTRPETALLEVSPELSVEGKCPVALEAKMQPLACVSLLLGHGMRSQVGETLFGLSAVVRLAS